MSDSSFWLWAGFNLFVLAMLALDLGVFHRKSHEVSVKEATGLESGLDRPGPGLQPGIYGFRGSAT